MACGSSQRTGWELDSLPTVADVERELGDGWILALPTVDAARELGGAVFPGGGRVARASPYTYS